MNRSYIVTFGLRDQPQDGRADLIARLGAMADVTATATGWQHVAGASLREGPDPDGFVLDAEDAALFAFLSDLLAAQAGAAWGMSFVIVDSGGEPVVTVYAGIDSLPVSDIQTGFRYVAADEILISQDIFLVTWPPLFADAAEPADSDGDEVYPQQSLAPAGQAIFDELTPPGDDDRVEMIFILPDADLQVETVMSAIVGADEVEVFDPEHLSVTRDDNGLAAEALTFRSDRGPVVELRLQVAESDSDRVRAVVAERAATISNVQPLIVIEEDFATFTFDVRPLGPDGDPGPAERIVYSLD